MFFEIFLYTVSSLYLGVTQSGLCETCLKGKKKKRKRKSRKEGGGGWEGREGPVLQAETGKGDPAQGLVHRGFQTDLEREWPEGERGAGGEHTRIT